MLQLQRLPKENVLDNRTEKSLAVMYPSSGLGRFWKSHDDSIVMSSARQSEMSSGSMAQIFPSSTHLILTSVK